MPRRAGPTEAPAVAGVVLAAGDSRRMGSPKPLLSLGGSTYLETIVDTLARSPVGPVSVVLGRAADQITEAVDLSAAAVLVNPRPDDGMLSSLQLAVRHLEATSPSTRGLLLVLVDAPRFSTATVTALVREFLRSGAPIVRPVHAGRHGHPVLFARSTWPELRSAPASQGARAVVHLHRDDLVEVPVDDPWVLQDADTPAEHEVMRRGDPSEIDSAG